MFALNMSLLLLSFVLTSTTIILQYNQVYFVKKFKLLRVVKQPLIQFLLISSLWFFRNMCQVKKIKFYIFVLANTIIMVYFFYFRLYVLTQATNLGNTKFVYLLYFFSFCLSSFFAISRLFFRIGYVINQQLIPSSEIILFGKNHFVKGVYGAFASLGKKIVGNMPTNPGSAGVDRHFILGVGTFSATAIAAGGAVIVAYDTHKGRLLAERNLIIKERSENRNAVKDNLMSKEDYDRKWDNWGNRRVN